MFLLFLDNFIGGGNEKILYYMRGDYYDLLTRILW